MGRRKFSLVTHIHCACALFAFVAGSWGQTGVPRPKPDESLSIAGLVLDGDTLQPVSDAEVTLSCLETPANAATSESTNTQRTGPSGSFAFDHPHATECAFVLRAAKEGYSPTALPLVDAAPRLSAGQGIRDIRLVLRAKSTISGQVYDAELERPVPNARVSAWRGYYLLGTRQVVPFGDATTTDARGSFKLTHLLPGDYYIEVQPNQLPDEKIRSSFTQDDLKKVDVGYSRSYWPNHDLVSATPVVLLSGVDLDVGTISLSRQPMYRAHVLLQSDTCSSDGKVSVKLYQSAGLNLVSAQAEFPCGTKELLVTSLRLGRHHLDVMTLGTTRELRRQAHAEFEVTDSNVEVSVPLHRGIDLHGTVRLPSDRHKNVLSGLYVGLYPLSGSTFSGDTRTLVEVNGEFHLLNYAWRDYQVVLFRLPEGLVVKETRYNGKPLVDDVLHLDPHAFSHSLEIVITDRPASVSGQVMGRAGPVNGGQVVLVKGPPREGSAYPRLLLAKADASGRYVIGGLAPGEYRLFAIAAHSAADLEAPNVLPRFLEKAKAVRLEEGGSQSLTLEVAEP